MTERAIRDPSVGGKQLAWMGQLQQMVYRKLVERTDLQDATLAALPEDVVDEARANLEAGLAFRAMISPGDRLPPWRIVEPPPADELLRLYQEAGRGVRRTLAVPRSREPGRDVHGPDPRYVGRRSTGTNAVHRVDVGGIRGRRHQRLPGRNPCSRSIPCS